MVELLIGLAIVQAILCIVYMATCLGAIARDRRKAESDKAHGCTCSHELTRTLHRADCPLHGWNNDPVIVRLRTVNGSATRVTVLDDWPNG